MLTSPRHDRFTLHNGRWTAHPSQHFGYAFTSALVDAAEEAAACSLMRNPILTEEFEKLAQSWLRLAKAAERGGLTSATSGRLLARTAKRKRTTRYCDDTRDRSCHSRLDKNPTDSWYDNY
jgi:hypothetical protein